MHKKSTCCLGLGDYSEPMLLKPLTVLEANALLPFAKERLLNLQVLSLKGQYLQQHLESKTTTKIVHFGVDGEQHKEVLNYTNTKKKLKALDQNIQNELLDLQSMGIIIRNIDPGRICFFAERHKQPVLLSWEAGEKQVSHWHRLDESFSMRQSIKQPDAFGQGYIH